MPNVLSPRTYIVSRPDNMDETVEHTGSNEVHLLFPLIIMSMN